ncbi:hypothetical protein [Actinocrinis sp.]|uniref:hypothetical protein n=1 Tax=Actinocrinis sp. TaxID=1920516 RepID=UPI002B9F3B4C|nr:hypothetical protein [Actinocrinis sp.]HXR73862.1 hypothetical protein [Actinocrinis sp.]
MKLLRTISEAEMVAAFLKAEISSTRFGSEVRAVMRSFGVPEHLVIHPDPADDHENALRAEVLGAYRGYRRNREMFEGVPDDLTWYKAELERSEIGNLRYVDYSYWNELTENTRLVKVGVANIMEGKVVFGVPNDRFLALAQDIRHGRHDFGPVILWAQDAAAPLEILEGHLRATALGLAGDEAPAAVEAIVGLLRGRLIPFLGANRPIDDPGCVAETSTDDPV